MMLIRMLLLFQVVIGTTTTHIRTILPYEQVAIGGHIYYFRDLYPTMEEDFIRGYRLEHCPLAELVGHK